MLLKNDPVGAFVYYPDAEPAHAPDGPLHGLGFGVKDVLDVAGYPTGAGNPLWLSEAKPATASADAVQALLDAGARFLGKTQTSEFAYSLDGRSAHYRTPLNVRAPGRVPGGSSSGSAAAVAAGLVDFALGSDTGGSIRTPAAYCGLIGFRPTHGRVSVRGMLTLAPSLDVVGWFADKGVVAEKVGEVLLGEDSAGAPLARMMIAEDAWALVTGEEEDAALRLAASRVSEHVTPAGAVTVAPEGLLAWQWVLKSIQGFEAWHEHGAWIRSRDAHLGPGVKERFEAASRVTAAQAEEARAKRVGIRERVVSLLGEDGVLVLPTVPNLAPWLDSSELALERYRGGALSALCIAGLSGLPQISLPIAESAGTPLGLSLIGPPGRDRALIALARKVLGS
ncbi:MAG: amidase [Bauldia sp.]|nr:amidase [Bauldia sp.]